MYYTLIMTEFQEVKPQSYLKIKRVGKIKEKGSGKEINQEFESKVFTSKTGLAAVKELKEMQKEFEEKEQKIGESDNPPKTMSQTV